MNGHFHAGCGQQSQNGGCAGAIGVGDGQGGAIEVGGGDRGGNGGLNPEAHGSVLKCKDLYCAAAQTAWPPHTAPCELSLLKGTMVVVKSNY